MKTPTIRDEMLASESIRRQGDTLRLRCWLIVTRIFFKQVNVSKKRKSNASTAKIDVEQALEDFTKALEEISLGLVFHRVAKGAS